MVMFVKSLQPLYGSVDIVIRSNIHLFALIGGSFCVLGTLASSCQYTFDQDGIVTIQMQCYVRNGA